VESRVLSVMTCRASYFMAVPPATRGCSTVAVRAGYVSRRGLGGPARTYEVRHVEHDVGMPAEEPSRVRRFKLRCCALPSRCNHGSALLNDASRSSSRADEHAQAVTAVQLPVCHRYVRRIHRFRRGKALPDRKRSGGRAHSRVERSNPSRSSILLTHNYSAALVAAPGSFLASEAPLPSTTPRGGRCGGSKWADDSVGQQL
jgi:hypothetical protein